VPVRLLLHVPDEARSLICQKEGSTAVFAMSSLYIVHMHCTSTTIVSTPLMTGILPMCSSCRRRYAVVLATRYSYLADYAQGQRPDDSALRFLACGTCTRQSGRFGMRFGRHNVTTSSLSSIICARCAPLCRIDFSPPGWLLPMPFGTCRQFLQP
jgi:hypothetical protein